MEQPTLETRHIGSRNRDQSQKTFKNFEKSIAVVIGINDYSNGITPLTTPVNDARRLAAVLEEDHDYEVHLVVEDVSKARFKSLLTDELKIGKNDRLLFYFAGHGIALDGEDGPQGYLVPQDADAANRETMLPMGDLHSWIDALSCRHMLAIFDCCFAGAFRWASTRHLNTASLEVIHKERFERFLQAPAWQALTSAAHNQTALDVVAGNAVGSRGIREEHGQQHSPFALALYEALRGEGDLIPKGDGDGVITATELYLYLREQVEVGVEEAVGHAQTPGLWPLNKHDHGEYIFLTPGHVLNLPPAPELTDELNPWRGLKSYDKEHGKLFFGRDQEIQELAEQLANNSFIAVLGASGTGKSSLVKAGLLPYLEQDETAAWHILPPLRPGRTPLLNLKTILTKGLNEKVTTAQLANDPHRLSKLLANWADRNPHSKLLLAVDQLEELVTLCPDKKRKQFLTLLANTVAQHPTTFRLVITLRTDFEPQFDTNTPLATLWPNSRYIVPPMDQADLRQVIEGPASERVLYFETPDLVETLITEVLQTPGALPLLSFTLSEMYFHYLKSERNDRALAQADYDALGGVIGSLRNRANEEYMTLPDDTHQTTMQQVMLRMIALEGGGVARRRVQRSELVYTNDAENKRVEHVLDRLVNARLLVTGEEDGKPTIEPAHDALMLAWDKLLRWKQSAESYLPLQRRLAQSATEWVLAEPDAQSGLLWDDDPRLPQLEETLWSTKAKHDGIRGRMNWARQVLIPNTDMPTDTRWLNGKEVTFVQASVRNRAQFWQRLVSGVSLFILVLITATIISWTLRQQAVAAEEAAVAEADARATEVVIRKAAELDAVNAEGTAVFNEELAVAAQGIAEVESAKAIQAQTTAEYNAKVAEERANVSLAQALAAFAPQQIDGPSQNDELSALLAIESYNRYLIGDGTGINFVDGALKDVLHQDLFSVVIADHSEGFIYELKFSKNAKKLGGISEDNVLWFWDVQRQFLKPKKKQLQASNSKQVCSRAGQVAFSSDLTLIACEDVGEDISEFFIWDTEKPSREKLRLTYQDSFSENSYWNHVQFSENGKYFWGVRQNHSGANKSFWIWDIESQNSIKSSPIIKIENVISIYPNATDAFQTDNFDKNKIIYISENYELNIVNLDNLETRKYPLNIELEKEQLTNVKVRISSDLNWVGLSSNLGVWIIRLAPYKAILLKSNDGSSGVPGIVFSPERNTFIIIDDQISSYWLGADFERLNEFSGTAYPTAHKSAIGNLLQIPNSNQFVSNLYRGLTIFESSFDEKDPIKVIIKPKPPSGEIEPAFAYAIDVSSDGKYVATESLYQVRIWKVSPPNTYFQELSNQQIEHMINSSDGEMIAVPDSSLNANFELVPLESLGTNIWSLSTNSPPSLIRKISQNGKAVAFSLDNKSLFSIGPENEIYLYADFLTNPISEIKGLAFSSISTAISPNGKYLAIGMEDNSLSIWDLSAPTSPPKNISGPFNFPICDTTPGAFVHPDCINMSPVAINLDATEFAIGQENGQVSVWDISGSKAKLKTREKMHFSKVSALKYSYSSQFIASGYRDGKIFVWNQSTSMNRTFDSLSTPEGVINELVFSLDDSFLTVSHATCQYCTANPLMVWEISNPNQPPIVLSGDSQVSGIFFSPLTNRLTTSSTKGLEAYTWSVDDLAAVGCSMTLRNFTWMEWQEYLSKYPYSKTCSNLPVHCSVPQEEWPKEYLAEREFCSAEENAN